MTPEETKKEIDELRARIDALSNSLSIPRDVETAFRERLGTLDASTKSASGHNQAVNESGSASYSVLKPPDGFSQVRINGLLVFIPYYLT